MRHHADPSIIERGVEKAHVWLKEAADELGTDDRLQAYRVLRAMLHAIRDRLRIDSAAELAAQLPTLGRGIYCEDWKPARTPLPIHDVGGFLGDVADAGPVVGSPDASLAVEVVVRVLRRHVSEGEVDDVVAVLPEPLKPLISV
jgi:uncharacterized protein (DUF2267 family)